MDFTKEDAVTLERIMRWRRDVRHFREDALDEAQIERLQQAMDLAPSVGNARPWRVIRVEDAGLRHAVHDNFLESNALAAQGYEGERLSEYNRLKLAGLDKAPLQLAVFTVNDPAEGHGLGRSSMPATLQASTAMAIHTLWLAARADNLGLGMVSILDPLAIERLLEVPEDWAFSAYLCVGHPEFTDDTPLLHRAGWQENHSHEWLRR
ncbi:5,6-dimethylbenzimidazole synthase [Novosphingobium terrae]|uniref:5,6-dimethylbenzimidazole synthase n=1 Tax=Novosphingobium terrae TaxID=2726189 RepID=UPI00197E8502|nr:5,6-dimethylbenzimidazole synthase [Novosphingobium terrae]